MKSPYKTVLMPIQTPDNDCCWDGYISCPHFDNEGGHPSCDLGYWMVKGAKHAPIPKPDKCKNLKTQSEKRA